MIVDMHNLLKHLQDDTKLCVCVCVSLGVCLCHSFFSFYLPYQLRKLILIENTLFPHFNMRLDKR